MAVSGFGTIYIQLDKGSYAPGQQVNGTIFLNVLQNFPGANELWVTISGMEDTLLVEQKSRQVSYHVNGETRYKTEYYYVTHQDFNTFFNHKFPVYKFTAAYVPAGQYTFPISFLLPSGLPSTFNYTFYKHGNCHARANYVLQATIRPINMTSVPPIQCIQAFVVNQEMVLNAGMQKKEMEKEITSCCCIGKGATKIVTYFEKNTYEPGEIAYMVTEIDNSRCKADIFEIRGLFKQTLRITARGYSEYIMLVHQTISLKGIKAGETLLGEHAKRLQIVLRSQSGALVQPTCRGRLISNEYSLVNKLKVDAILCCDHNPAHELGLTVRNQDLHYEKWSEMPSNWNPQVMGAYNAQFTSEYSENVFYPPETITLPDGGMPMPPINPDTPATAKRGELPYPAHPVQPGMPGPGMPHNGGASYPAMPAPPGGMTMPSTPSHDGNVSYPMMPPPPGANSNSGTPVDREDAMPGQPVMPPPLGSEPGKPFMPSNVPVITEHDIPIKPTDKPHERTKDDKPQF